MSETREDEPTAEAQALLGRLRAALGQLEDALGAVGAQEARDQRDITECGRYRTWAHGLLGTRHDAQAWMFDSDVRDKVGAMVVPTVTPAAEQDRSEPPPGYIADRPGEGFGGSEVWWATIADLHGSSTRDGAIATCWAHHDTITAPLRRRLDKVRAELAEVTGERDAFVQDLESSRLAARQRLQHLREASESHRAESERMRSAWAQALGAECTAVDQLADLTRQLRDERDSASEAATRRAQRVAALQQALERHKATAELPEGARLGSATALGEVCWSDEQGESVAYFQYGKLSSLRKDGDAWRDRGCPIGIARTVLANVGSDT